MLIPNFVGELCQQKAISPVTSWAYQAYSAVTGVTVYKTALPQYWWVFTTDQSFNHSRRTNV